MRASPASHGFHGSATLHSPRSAELRRHCASCGVQRVRSCASRSIILVQSQTNRASQKRAKKRRDNLKLSKDLFQCGTLSELLNFTHENIDSYTPRHYAQTMQLLVKAMKRFEFTTSDEDESDSTTNTLMTRHHQVELLMKQLGTKMPEFDDDSLSLVFKSLSQMRAQISDPLKEALSARIIELQDKFTAYSLMQLARSFNTLAWYPAPEVLKAIADAVVALLQAWHKTKKLIFFWKQKPEPTFEERLLAGKGNTGVQTKRKPYTLKLTVAMARLISNCEYHHTELQSNLAADAIRNVDSLFMGDLPHMLKLFLRLRHPPAEQLTPLLDLARKGVERREFRPRTLCMVLWCLSLLQACPPQTCKAGMSTLHNCEGKLSPGLLSAFYQSVLLVADQYPTSGVLAEPAAILSAAQSAWSINARDNTVSQFQMQLHTTLEACGFRPQLEYATACGNFSLDLALPEMGIAIEADGPSHFATNKHMFLGESISRQRCILARGWVLICVPSFVWQTLTTRQAQMQAMQEVLEEAKKLRATITESLQASNRPWEHDGVLLKIWQLPAVEVIVMQTQELPIHEPGAVTVTDAL
ncbi:hypothetical protein WJX73_006712 [Symbiochloris irregularis]|uniref:RAP domain-containing protein n=1 Tax=Symbiochloris irregularis TaxID=706552 RepID=A0AAW1NNF7_9CHLO